jgi:hypothetical protein
LIAAQTLLQRPIDDCHLPAPPVIENVARVRIAVKNHILLRRQQRIRDQCLHQLLRHQLLPLCGKICNGTCNLESRLLRQSCDPVRTKRPGNTRHAHAREIPIQVGSFQQRLLFAPEIHLVLQQTPHFLERVRDQVRRKTVRVVLVAEVLGQPL